MHTLCKITQKHVLEGIEGNDLKPILFLGNDLGVIEHKTRGFFSSDSICDPSVIGASVAPSFRLTFSPCALSAEPDCLFCVPSDSPPLAKIDGWPKSTIGQNRPWFCQMLMVLSNVNGSVNHCWFCQPLMVPSTINSQLTVDH